MPKSLMGERIRRARGDMKQEAVAKALGIRQSTLSMYERGHRMPTDRMKMRIAEYFGMSVETLFYDKEEEGEK